MIYTTVCLPVTLHLMYEVAKPFIYGDVVHLIPDIITRTLPCVTGVAGTKYSSSLVHGLCTFLPTTCLVHYVFSNQWHPTVSFSGSCSLPTLSPITITISWLTHFPYVSSRSLYKSCISSSVLALVGEYTWIMDISNGCPWIFTSNILSGIAWYPKTDRYTALLSSNPTPCLCSFLCHE